jgi:hypothetical protein
MRTLICGLLLLISTTSITGARKEIAMGGDAALHGNAGESSDVKRADPSPFVVTVVPSWSKPPGPWNKSSGRGIEMGMNTFRTLYVILTNVSKQTQAVFEPSHSWGYYAISFELRTGDGRSVEIRKKQAGFTMNVPSTFLIPPGEQMVYLIKLDDKWVADPGLPITEKEPIDIRVKAIYEIVPTPESTQQSVWTGHAESEEYHFEFLHGS